MQLPIALLITPPFALSVGGGEGGRACGDLWRSVALLFLFGPGHGDSWEMAAS